MAHKEDVNGDGLVDLVLQIATENLDPELFQDGYAILTGATFGGLDIEPLAVWILRAKTKLLSCRRSRNRGLTPALPESICLQIAYPIFATNGGTVWPCRFLLPRLLQRTF
jgi:hypothetical protein